MRALVIYESLTGTTRTTAGHIATELRERGWEASTCSTRRVDLAALQHADVLVVGTWVDGLILVGQRPGGRGHLAGLPLLGGKPTYAFVTYAIDAGKTLDKLTGVLAERGADVQGAMTIRRDRIVEGATDFADRLVSAVAPA
jgi:hypothetical protein